MGTVFLYAGPCRSNASHASDSAHITGPGAFSHTLKSYATLHEGGLDIKGGMTLFLVYPLQFLRPFQDWTSSAPEWWNAYNSVKHDRIENYSNATYAHTVQAMAALHLLLAFSWKFRYRPAKIQLTRPNLFVG
jgi:hypothetical protein